MTVRRWVTIGAGICILLVLAVWGAAEVRALVEYAAPRWKDFRIWPDGQVVRSRALVQRVNIHSPEFSKLTRAISGKDEGKARTAAFAAGLRYYAYITDWSPNRFDAYLLKGVCEYGLGRNAEAEADFKRAMFLQPSFFWTQYNLAMLYFNNGAYRVAREFIDGALIRLRRYDEKVLAGSKIFLDLLHADEPQSLAQNLVDASLGLYKARAIAAFFMGDHVGMLEASEAGLKLGQDPEGLLLSGVASFQLEDDTHAIQALSQAIVQKPSLSAAHFFLALSFKRAGDTARFMAHYKIAQELGFDPNQFLRDKKFPLRVY